jgi:hypothetical protein
MVKMVQNSRPEILNNILAEARLQKKIGIPQKVIFDLDSTLFDVSPRITEIMRAFARDPQMQIRFPNETKVLAIMEPHVNDYGIRRTLQRYNFEHPHPEFSQTIMEYWKLHFFGNHFLHFDLPYPGAIEFVKDIANEGAEIFYLTGRDIPRMLTGTVNQIKQHDLPLRDDLSNLILKPETGASDTLFKNDFFLKMDRSEAPVWFFENEPANIYIVYKNCPHIKIIFVETVHSESLPPPGAEIPKITSFEI